MGRKRLGVVATMIAALSIGAATAHADEIRVRSTTDTKDAGLYDGLIESAYKAVHPEDHVNYVTVGTGQALLDARNGLADVVVTHAPSQETTFVNDGFSLEPYGRAIFYSDYVIVGPADDPAGVFSGAAHDAVKAYELIAAAGAAGKATFVTRADASASGTTNQEQKIWGLTDDTVVKDVAFNAGSDATRKEPHSGAGYPDWYERNTVQTGQAGNLRFTDACAVTGTNPNGGCYTMVDRGTYNKEINAGTVTKLKLLSEKNATSARGGENLLINPFSTYIVNPDKFADGAKPNVAAATRFVDFLTSPEFQAAVDGFPTAADPAFRGDAFPKVDVTAPAVATTGSTLSLPVTFTNKLPGGTLGAGYPVQLQQSTDGGATFTNVGTPALTDDAGKVSLSATIGSSLTTFRVSLPRFHQFSPFTSVLTTVAATPSTGQPAPPVVVTPVDKTAPTISKVALSSKKLTLTASEGGTVVVKIALKTTKKVKGKSKTTYKTKKTVTLRPTKAGAVSTKLKTLAAGHYRLTITSKDAAGNTSTRTVNVVIKAAKKKAKKR